MTELRDAALAYAQRGWRVFPLHGIVNGRCTCGRSDCSISGKHPLVRRGLHEATTDLSMIENWWRRWRSANVGIATGAESGIVVIDVDLPAALASLDALIHKLPDTLTGLTGGGGLHLIYRGPCADLRCTTAQVPGIGDLPGVDLRANGGYIVAPPSMHRSGQRYSWLDANRPIAPAPVWLKQPQRTYASLDVVAPANFDGDGTAYGRAALDSALASLRKAPLGQRNHSLNKIAFALAQLVAGGKLLETAARTSCQAGSSTPSSRGLSPSPSPSRSAGTRRAAVGATLGRARSS